MATGQYIGVNGVARKVITPYIGVNGVARNVKAGYVGVNGVARLFFAPVGGKVILQVEKITSDTYANDTTYTGEQFVIIGVHPKPNGTVKVTYGGLTKTITDTSGEVATVAQKVFFGTFNGVSDSVETPARGEMSIEGDYVAVSIMAITTSKTTTSHCDCITAITDWGVIEEIPNNAFQMATKMTSVTIPECVKTIGYGAFRLEESYSRTVIMKATTPPALKKSTLGSDPSYAFDVVGTNNIIVPMGCATAYKTAEGWSTYADYITEASV